jgi:hypothetical protein
VEVTNVAYEMTGSGFRGGLQQRAADAAKDGPYQGGRGRDRNRSGYSRRSMAARRRFQTHKPLYAVTASGVGRRQSAPTLVISRGLEEVEWWSAYALGTGAQSFDTYVAGASGSLSAGLPGSRAMQVSKFHRTMQPTDDCGRECGRGADVFFGVPRDEGGPDHVRQYRACEVAPFYADSRAVPP